MLPPPSSGRRLMAHYNEIITTRMIPSTHNTSNNIKKKSYGVDGSVEESKEKMHSISAFTSGKLQQEEKEGNVVL
ncbi:hypothetical protein FOZ61_009832 [Perkinsus olseni]|uniref:Uncharacterized protein n=1 Tax=Perkinsus olseni TaxID=32597 RepID=A0A7J6L0B9_PEROL|nr:hypothetical protein FOZ61_009832 [Perkinsus olseni]